MSVLFIRFDDKVTASSTSYRQMTVLAFKYIFDCHVPLKRVSDFDLENFSTLFNIIRVLFERKQYFNLNVESTFQRILTHVVIILFLSVSNFGHRYLFWLLLYENVIVR